MFRAIDKDCGKEIIILDGKWHQGNIEQLRLKGRSEMLRCPECQQPVLVRAGNQKRWHFAHKILAKCPLQNESAMILQARSLLYQWLQSKFNDKVTIEKKIEECPFSRPVDCYVQMDNGAEFVYWILEAGIRSRNDLLYSIKKSNIRIHWVFLQHMLREDEKHSNEFHLSPTERDFLDYSEYMKVYNGPSLHYLKIETSELKTLRGLVLIHSPQKYKCKRVVSDLLKETLISPRTGEFVHLGEYEKLTEFRKRQKLKQEKPQTSTKRKEDESFVESEEDISLEFKEELSHQKKQSVKSQSDVLSILKAPAPCEICGKLTKEWITFSFATKTCRCKECLEKKS
jgi:hypothetical protein